MRVAIVYVCVVLIGAGSLPARAQGGQTQNPSSGKSTPIGTQVPTPTSPFKNPNAHPGAQNPPAPPAEPPAQALQRALNAHGGSQNIKAVTDAVAQGTVTFYTTQGPQTPLPVTPTQKGNDHVQRVISRPNGEHRQGSDGTQTWDSFGHQWTAAQGPPGQLVETQTVRNLSNLFDYQTRGSQLRDDGMRGPDRVLSVIETNGRLTSYVIDGTSSRVSHIEFVSGMANDPFSSRKIPVVESFALSDYRVLKGVWTPFNIAHYSGGMKIEEMQFTSVDLNTGVKNDAFHR